MQRRLGAFFLFAFLAAPTHQASAEQLPDIKISAKNPVPACATPGRMMAYLKSRNPELNPRYEGIATEYMRHGETLGVRWDFAFYQMLIETGSLSYMRGSRAGDVKPAQNNFAGLGATGKGEPGDSFADISSGVRGHLEHLLLYSGQRVDNPVAERTRKVQEWGVLTSWQQRFNRPITFADLAAKWAPGSGGYSRMMGDIAETFDDDFCSKPDPRPELVAEARGGRGALQTASTQTGSTQAASSLATTRPVERAAEAKIVAKADPSSDMKSGAELAQRALEDSKDGRSGLGAQEVAKGPMPFKVLNSPQAAATLEPQQAAEPAKKEPDTKVVAKDAPAKDIGKAKAADKGGVRYAAAGGAGVAAKQLIEPVPAGQKCRVWTASYGGQKAMIIRSIVDKVVNFTVLDVNEGAETREAEAFIAAYAKDGKITGEFASQTQALDKAFELCPEG